MLFARKSVLLLLLALAFACAGSASAAGPLRGHLQTGQAQNSQPDAKQLSASLDDIISTLENDDKRAALVTQLKQLRQSTRADARQHSVFSGAGHGLLGNLSNSLTRSVQQIERGGPPQQIWHDKFQQAGADIQQLFNASHTPQLLRYSIETLVGLLVWAAILLLVHALQRRFFAHWQWPVRLPLEPRPRILAAHVGRRLLPLLLIFIALLVWVRLLGRVSPPGVLLLVVSYIALCGAILATAFESIVSLFSRDHRRTAVTILRQHALVPLFIVGALVAFGDAVTSSHLVQGLGQGLSDLLSSLSNLLAALFSGYLVMRFRRPVKHLICNRSLANRRKRSFYLEPFFTLGRLWAAPALLLVAASAVAILVTGGQVYLAFARAIICAFLLVLVLIVNGLIGRKNARAARYQPKHKYAGRMRRLGYILARAITWLVYAELTARTLGFSLFSLGEHGAIGNGIGHIIVSVGTTILLAWLVWIVTDTAIHYFLHSRNSYSKRRNRNRAKTITPMIRNLALSVIIIVAGIILLANLGINITPILAGAGVIGLALGFGAQSLVADLITGIFILIEDSIAVGDFVKINNYMGTVEGLNLRIVRMRDLDGVLHITTFSHIDSIHNMSRNFGIALMKLRLPHDLPIDDAIALMHRTALDVQADAFIRSLIRSPLEIQDITEFDNGCPILRMRFFTAPEYQWNVSRAFNLALKRRMEKEYINLGTPRLSISMESGGGARIDDHGKQAGDDNMQHPVTSPSP